MNANVAAPVLALPDMAAVSAAVCLSLAAPICSASPPAVPWHNSNHLENGHLRAFSSDVLDNFMRLCVLERWLVKVGGLVAFCTANKCRLSQKGGLLC
jgi:hypothetical protein